MQTEVWYLQFLYRRREKDLEIIFGIVGVIGLVIGIPGCILAWPSIKGYAKSLNAKHVIVLFGPKAAGKTTLVRYLQGRPLPQHHLETHSYQRSGKIVYDLSGQKTFFFTMKEVVDMGGEFKSQLKPICLKDNPHAVILVCDTTQERLEKQSLEAVVEAYRDILSERPVEELRLRVLLILLNKCDVWGTDTRTQHEMKEKYKDTVLTDPIHQLRRLIPDLDVHVRPVSLMHSTYKPQTDNALRDLAQLLAPGS